MSCTNCKKDIMGEFIVWSFGGCSVDKNDSGKDLPKWLSMDGWHNVVCHSDNDSVYKELSLEEDFKGHADRWSYQGEIYFCTKKCLLDWFGKKLEELPDPKGN
jgi:hypothetical protein